jgi:hypothetical protein
MDAGKPNTLIIEVSNLRVLGECSDFWASVYEH